MEDLILKTENLTYAYSKGSTLIFKDLSVIKKQHTLILGDSGTGKSTLLHLLGGLSKPKTGKVIIERQHLYELNESALDRFRAQNIGFIFQEAHLLRNLTIVENIQLAQTLAGHPINQQHIHELLEKLQLEDHAQKRPNQLSRGQIQRVSIARAIINRPALLLADEPTASLDDTNTYRVLETLKQMADIQGSTLLISTHDKRIKDEFSNTYILNTI